MLRRRLISLCIFPVMKKIAALTSIPRNDELKITDRAHALMQKVRGTMVQAVSDSISSYSRFHSGLNRLTTASLLRLLVMETSPRMPRRERLRKIRQRLMHQPLRTKARRPSTNQQSRRSTHKNFGTKSRAPTAGDLSIPDGQASNGSDDFCLRLSNFASSSFFSFLGGPNIKHVACIAIERFNAIAATGCLQCKIADAAR